MAIRIIVKEPDEVLHKKAKEVTKITPNVQKLLDDMADTMYDAEGVGLAAPQVGILKRLIVIDAGDEHGLIKMINPEIVESEGEQFGPEGCLSIPGWNGDVRRAEKVTVKGLDREGNELVITGTGLLARAFQHEIDHLNGVLFTEIADRVYEYVPEQPRNELENR
ncbi:peptide deformylase [Paenibacillus lautus]|jgi:peptide deformylase|uniref:Peptide deformylase n=1 Tax=Paenibacillus lautus TaxID=1401 RepID=A0A2A5LQ42_PAELA|nr:MULTISPECIES: peptide deformylase [Paenibacillus]MBY0160167.1 peptide deformylase [Cytobacillus firmus]VTR41054.1 peptide deformylase [Actinobacillus pleuropneumoniae]ACX64232.1 peptide deformylase [Paenibacillus sp. Y412MC10]AYB45423.1 peptide deformylase [Paenibacillus lautus]ETT57190.1 peptide deformylase [Paenibacillus sp. FSL H8-457]